MCACLEKTNMFIQLFFLFITFFPPYHLPKLFKINADLKINKHWLKCGLTENYR